MNRIGIETTRYSSVVRAFLDRHPDAVARLDRETVSTDLEKWCTNSRLMSLRDFNLTVRDEEILSFHDHPDELLAAESQLALVKELAKQKVLRFRILHEKQSLLKRLLGKQ